MAAQGWWKGRPVVVTGGQGFLGSKVLGRLLDLGARAVSCSRRTGCDLRNLEAAEKFFRAHRPEIVINCAANQGGIAYQRVKPGTIFLDNLLMGTNTMEAARRASVRRYVNIIAGCAYPGEPREGLLRENEIQDGALHPSVENYGAAKRAALTQAQCYRREFGFDGVSLVLVNLYGPGEHFDPDRSHALAALLRKFYEAKTSGAPSVVLWGTGRAVREWTFVEDAAEGVLRAAERYTEGGPLNIAVGRGHTIAELAGIIREVVGYDGGIEFDATKPDGARHKVADISRMKAALEWEPPTPLEAGIRRTLEWFVSNHDRAVAEVS